MISDDGLYENISKIRGHWRFAPEGKAKDKAFVMIDAIEQNGTGKGVSRGFKQIRFNQAYDDAIEKLFHLANTAPNELFQKIYNLVIQFGGILYDEKAFFKDAFTNPRRYREIRRGNFISKIDINHFSDALFHGCKIAMMHEIGQIKQMYPSFKGRTSMEFLRIVATSHMLNLSPQKARGYLRVSTGRSYAIARIEKLYKKLG